VGANGREAYSDFGSEGFSTSRGGGAFRSPPHPQHPGAMRPHPPHQGARPASGRAWTPLERQLTARGSGSGACDSLTSGSRTDNVVRDP